MKVKLCRRCPYRPSDLAGHYDSEAALHVCARCDGDQVQLTSHYPRDLYRRRICLAARNGFAAGRGAVLSTTEAST
jgi:hypothetical protein